MKTSSLDCFFLNIRVDISKLEKCCSMAFQKQCPSCTKYVTVATSDGNYASTHRCQHCGFTINIPPPQNKMKSGDYGD